MISDPVKGEDVIRARPTIAAPRIAVLGTPCSGGTWVRRAFADAIDAVDQAAAHPADISWDTLPSRAVIELPWPPTILLRDMLHEHSFSVVTVARHPLDVLSALHGSNPHAAGSERQDCVDGDSQIPEAGPRDDFLEWATSAQAKALLALTVQWWCRPSTVRMRYEDVVTDPVGQVTVALSALNLAPVGGQDQVAALPATWRHQLGVAEVDQLLRVHADVIIALGYDIEDRG